jgi:hypothetical protein
VVPRGALPTLSPSPADLALRMLPSVRSILLCLLALLCAPAPAHALTVGMGDQKPETFSDPRFEALGLRHARYVVPFDVALRHDGRRQQFDRWLATAQARGIEPLVAFYSDSGRRTPPSVATYRRAVRAFHATYPSVRNLTTWNEVNRSVLHRHPRRAAQMYRALVGVCPSCRVVAADVLDDGNMVRFLRAFRRHAPSARLWGLHNYIDANRNRTVGTRRMLATVRGQVWLTEVGGIVRTRTARWNEAQQAVATRRTFALARSSARIKRVYLYHWSGGQRTWDSGFIAPSGRARPALAALRAELARLRH